MEANYNYTRFTAQASKAIHTGTIISIDDVIAGPVIFTRITGTFIDVYKIHIYLFIYLFIYLIFIYLLCTYLSIYLFIHLFISIFIYLQQCNPQVIMLAMQCSVLTCSIQNLTIFAVQSSKSSHTLARVVSAISYTGHVVRARATVTWTHLLG